MKRPISISARNLKGASFDHQLAPVTFFVGPNYAGKTARADAIRLVLAGFLPELGKTNGATFGLASAKGLTVSALVADGLMQQQISRSWTAVGDSVKATANLPAEFEDPVVQGQSEVMLNAESWFGLTESERVDWVFQNCAGPSKLDRGAVEDRIHGKVKEADSTNCYTKIWAKVYASVIAAERMDGPMTLNAYVSSILEASQKVAKESKAYAAQMDKTAAGLASLRASDLEVYDLVEIETKIKKTTEEMETIRNERATHSAKEQTEFVQANRKKTLARDLAVKVQYEATLKTLRDTAASFAAVLEKLNRELASLPVNDPDALMRYREEYRRADRDLSTAKADMAQVVSSIAKNEGDKSSLNSQKVCPYCGAAGEGWKALKLAEINSTLAGLRSKRETLEETVSNAKSRAEDAGRRVSSIENAVADRMTLMAKISEAEKSVTQANSDVSQSEHMIALYAAKQGEHDAIPAPTEGLKETVTKHDDALLEKSKELHAHEQTRRAALGRDNDKKRLAEAEKNRDDAKAEETVAKAVVEEIKVLKAEMVAEVFGPLINTANRFAGPLLKNPLGFNADKNEVGAIVHGVWVGHKTFSGVEKLVSYAAIQAAFASRAPLRVMILDEMLRAEGDVFLSLVGQCKMAVREGTIDNFVGTIPGKADDMSLRAALVVDEDPAFAQIVEIK